MSLLELKRAGPQLWEAFHTRRLRAQSSHPVLDRWRRAHQLGVCPEGNPESSELLRGSALRQHQERADNLMVAADEALGQGEAHLSQADYSLLLTDAQGVILRARAGGHFRDTARRLRLIEGGRWAEKIQGTNAIGTALVERRPVTVFGDAHFVRSNHDLICYACPVFDPYGELIGALDATSRAEAAHPGIQWAVNQAARLLQEALRDQAWSRLGQQATQPLLQRCSLPTLLVESPGLIREANPAAARALGRSPSGVALEQVCGLSWRDLLSAFKQGRDRIELPRWGGQPGPHFANLHPVMGQPNLPLGVWVFVETKAASLTSSATVPGGSSSSTSRRRARPEVLQHFNKLLGSDPVMQATRQMAARIAPGNLPVLLLAETGTGKGMLARAIHDASSRADGPLVHINCGALSDQLLESELFGYASGAFTGARREGREGRIQSAMGGTLFLDEIAEMSPHLQAALLKVLEDKTYFRIGDNKARQADFRLICATCRDLEALMDEGTFRRDLYYRIRGATLSLPSLHQRTDVLELAQGLLKQLAGEEGLPTPQISEEVAMALQAHRWPGNIRELRMALQFAMAMSLDGVLELEDLPVELQQVTPSMVQGMSVMYTSKQQALLRVLRETTGNISEAARRLGVARSTVYRMMRRHNLNSSDSEDV